MTPEQFAGWMDEKGYKPNGETFEDLLKDLENQIARNYVKGMVKAAKIEREECAKVCDARADADGFEGNYANHCAMEIRARGKL